MKNKPFSTADFEKEKVEMWKWQEQQKIDYKLGKLKPWQIQKLEALPNWTWVPNETINGWNQ